MDPAEKPPLTLTIRCIKSFEYRTCKNLVLHDVPLSMSVKELKDLVLTRIQSTPGWKPYLTTSFDTLKVYFAAHGTKTQNLIINLDHDDDNSSPWIMTDNKTLSDYKLENEAEISFFVKAQYDAFKAHPETKW